MRELYPEIEPYAVHALDVGDGYVLHLEECGNPGGVPVLFLHGGPGSGCKTYHRRFFHPGKFRAILFDQRGAGRSTPFGGLVANTTAHLLADIERIRIHLGVDRWHLFGGSWGSTLALLYAEMYPERVLTLTLRGVFLARARDLDWFTGDGVRRIYPESWRAVAARMPLTLRDRPVAAIHAALAADDALAAARAWLDWGAQVALGGAFDPGNAQWVDTDDLALARLEAHYAVNGYFLAENQILESIGRIVHLSAHIVQGRLDLTCPVDGADALHRALPGSTLEILPQGGHIAGTPDMIDALVRAADALGDPDPA